MRKLLPLLWIILAPWVAGAQQSNPAFDEELAKKLGADDYGMKNYVLVILKTGENKTTDRDIISNSFAGHMRNMERLTKEGKLIVAGPIGRNENSYRGIFILDVPSLEEAKKIVGTDPAVSSGLLAADLYQWYGSAALPLYLEAADKIWKQNP